MKDYFGDDGSLVVSSYLNKSPLRWRIVNKSIRVVTKILNYRPQNLKFRKVAPNEEKGERLTPNEENVANF